MSAPFKIVGLDHVVLRARDPGALEKFYIDVLGCTLELRQGKLAQLRAGSALIDIVPADEEGPAKGTSSTGGANLDHLCLRIEPFDAGAIAQHLAAQRRAMRCGGTTLRCRRARSFAFTSTIPKERRRAERPGEKLMRCKPSLSKTQRQE